MTNARKWQSGHHHLRSHQPEIDPWGRRFFDAFPDVLFAALLPLFAVCREGSTELAIKKNYPCKKITAVNHCTPRIDLGGE